MIDTAIFLREIILIMTLRADIGAHLIMRSLADIYTAAGHRLDEALLIDSQLHSLRIMTGRAAEPLILFDWCSNFIEWLGSKIPATLLEVDIIHIGALADDAGPLLSRTAFRFQDILSGIGMPTVIIILQCKLIPLEILQHLRLFLEVVYLVRSTIAGRRRMHFIVLHERLVFQRVSVFISFLPQLLILRDLGQLYAVVIRRSADANHDEPEEYDADRYNPR